MTFPTPVPLGRGRITTMSDKPTAILYARVSTRAQAEEGYGIDYQLRELREWVTREGYEIVREIREPGYSRESWNRPGLDEIRHLAESGFRGDVLAWRRDRYFADPVYRGLFAREMEEYGIRLRATNDSGGDSPTDEFTDGILDLIARMEIRTTAERTRAGKRERASQGKYVWAGAVPYGYKYTNGELHVDPATARNVERIFRVVGYEGRGMNQVRRLFMSEGIPSPRGSRTWHVSTISRIVNNDIYLSRPYEEVAEQVPNEVVARLDPSEHYAITHYNQRRTRTVHTMTGRGRSVTFNDPEAWIAVPVPELGVPPEWVHAARRNVAKRTAWQPSDRREWPLRGLAHCPCGRQLLTYYTTRGGFYYVCPRKRREGGCPEGGHYIRAEPLEEQVADFTLGLLRNPEVLREKVEQQLERERATLCNPEREIRALSDRLWTIERKRSGFQHQAAEGLMTLDELRANLSELDEQRKVVERERDALRESEARLEELDEQAALIDQYLRELPDLIDSQPLLREHETVPAKRTEDNPLGAYHLTPERIRRLSEEEVSDKRRAAADARTRRYRALYDGLNLNVVPYADGSLKVTWAGDCTLLQPSG